MAYKWTIKHEDIAEAGVDALMDMLRYDSATVLDRTELGWELCSDRGVTTGRWASFGLHAYNSDGVRHETEANFRQTTDEVVF